MQQLQYTQEFTKKSHEDFKVALVHEQYWGSLCD